MDFLFEAHMPRPTHTHTVAVKRFRETNSGVITHTIPKLTEQQIRYVENYA